MGIARPVDGGYIFNGRWQFSSGTDHCDWIFLGGMLGDDDGKMVMPPQSLHLILPRSDYEIVQDSWDVAGLKGTGSKDIIVKDAFVPTYRTLEYLQGRGRHRAPRGRVTNPSYLMPFSCVFPLGITSAVIGIAEGALYHHLAYQRNRVQITGTKIKDDPYVLYAISEAAEEIKASRTALLDNCSRMYDMVASGHVPTFAERAVPAAHPGARRVAGGTGDERDRRPVGRQRDAQRQPDPALLARRPRGAGARDPRAGLGLPRVGPDGPGHRARRPDALHDLTPTFPLIAACCCYGRIHNNNTPQLNGGGRGLRLVWASR